MNILQASGQKTRLAPPALFVLISISGLSGCKQQNRADLGKKSGLISSMAFMPFSNEIAVSKIDFNFDNRGKKVSSNSRIEIWDSDNQKLERTLLVGEPTHQIGHLSFSANGKLLGFIVGGRVKILNATTWKPISLPPAMNLDHSEESAVKFSPIQNVLAIGSIRHNYQAGNGSVAIWNLQKGVREDFLQIPAKRLAALSFSSEGRFLGISCQNWGEDRAAQVFTYDFKTRKKSMHSLKIEMPAYSIEFSPKASAIAIDAITTVKLWNYETGVTEHTFSGGGSDVLFTPDGNELIFIDSSRGEVVFRRIKDGKILHRFKFRGGLSSSLAVSSDGKTVAAAGWATPVTVWHIN